jgi:hypothetical protein
MAEWPRGGTQPPSRPRGKTKILAKASSSPTIVAGTVTAFTDTRVPGPLPARFARVWQQEETRAFVPDSR